MNALIALACFLLLLDVVIYHGAWRVQFWRHHALTPVLTRRRVRKAEAPFVTICVPARNEERGITKALRSLAAQDYPRFRILVANDHSTDRTGALARAVAAEAPSGLLDVFDVPDLPAGWMGKCHALFRCMERAPQETELILFTDADVVHRPETLSRAVRHLQNQRADLLALMPRVDNVGFWESVTLPVLMAIAVTKLDPRRLNDPTRREVVGIGAFTLIRKAVYDGWGGHRAIRGETLDDMALGVMTKNAGGKLVLVRDTAGAVRLRMYTSLRNIVQGFEKNMHTAIGGSFLRTAAAAVGFSLVHMLALLAAGAAWAGGSPALAAVALLAHVLAGSALAARAGKYMRFQHWALVLGYPLGALVASAVMVRSAWHAEVQGVVHWRGRKLPRARQRTKLIH